jgi:hypothetical protein
VAGIGAAEAGGEAYAQSLTDLDLSDTDVLLATGLGAVAGGALGGIAPRFIGRIATQAEVSAKEAEIAAMFAERESLINLQGGSVGAARVQEGEFGGLDFVTPAKASGSIIAGKTIPSALRSPKNVAADMFVKGTKLKAEHGLEGNLRFGQAFEV